MIVYKVIHKYKLCKHNEIKNIGIYKSYELAEKAVEQLKTKQGFCDIPKGFIIKKTFRIWTPKHIDKTFWVDGFVTYTL